MAVINTTYVTQHYTCFYFFISLYVIIIHGVIAPEHGRDIFDRIDVTEKGFLLKLISTVQLSGAKFYDTQVVINYANHTADVSLAQ